MRWQNIKKLSNNQFRRVSGVKKTTFLKLVDLLRSKWILRRRAGGPRPKLSLENQLLLVLSYWRNYGTFLETGTKFGVSETVAWKICRWIEDNLKNEKTLHLPGRRSLLSGKEKYEVVAFDVTECPIERPKKKNWGRRKHQQNDVSSGKKKRHTIKQQIVVDTRTQKIISTCQSNGKTHDFKI